MQLFMVYRSMKHSMAILYDVLVKVETFLFLANFMILDCDVDLKFQSYLDDHS